MTNSPGSRQFPDHPSTDLTTPAAEVLSWPMAIGLGSLGLLWPLTGLLGLTDLLGAATRSAVLVIIIGATWIGVVGLGRLARPVVMLALTGLVAGTLMALAAMTLGDVSGGRIGLVAIWTIVGQALLGTVAGVLALGVQKVRA